MDLLSLSLCGRFCRIVPNVLRFIAAAAAGALYGTIVTALDYNSLIISAFVSMVICFIAVGSLKFNATAVRTWLSVWLLFLCVCSLLGGLMTVLFSVRLEITENVGAVMRSPWEFVAAAVLSALTAYIFSRVSNKHSTAANVKLCVTVNGKFVVFDVLRDSGNLLVEPISGSPVAVVSERVIRKILPGCDKITGTVSADVPYELRSRVRLVSFERVGESSMRFVIKPDDATVDGVRREIMLLPEAKPENAYGGFSGTINI